MQRTSFSITFYIKRNAPVKSGECPLILRVTVNGTRAASSTGLRVDPKLWDNTAEKSKGRDKNAVILNQHIDALKAKVMKIHHQLELEGAEGFIAQDIINLFQGKNAKKKIMLIEYFQEHNNRCREKIGKGMAAATVERYETSLRLTQEFLQLQFGSKDIPLEDVNHKFITDYEHFFKTVRNCAHNTTTKYLKNFKKIIRIALANEDIKKDPFVHIKFHLDKIEKPYLTVREIKIIYNKEFSTDRLVRVRDMFVFGCLTGLAFSDIKGLTSEHILIDGDGDMYIEKKRQKTDVPSKISLCPTAIEILEKYKGHPKCKGTPYLLPIGSNTKMNAYLKEIADVCGINKEISTHTARHTFATMCNELGIPMESIAKMIGHNSVNMTRQYAKITETKVFNDAKDLFKKIDM